MEISNVLLRAVLADKQPYWQYFKYSHVPLDKSKHSGYKRAVK